MYQRKSTVHDSQSKVERRKAGVWRLAATAVLSVIVLASALALTNCGSSRVEITSNPPRGSVSVSMSDPPVCRFPAGDFKHVYVTVRGVQAHLSSSAGDAAAGWQEMAPQLATTPVQLDLLANPSNGCVLAQLGSNASFPVGDYQQIRLLLLSNSPSGSDPRPATNNCGSQGFNCVVLADDSVHQLDLSSQANTGLKIPPGQILGGPLRVGDGQHVDLNIDFNTCASLVPQRNGRFRLRPVLTAGQVGTVTTGISGQVVDSATTLAIPNGQVIVAIEQADSTGLEMVIAQDTADSEGRFNFCPLPSGTYDIVAVALNADGNTLGATAALNVNAGTAVGKIPVVLGGAAGKIEGTVTSVAGSSPANIDVAVGALQFISVPGGTTRQLVIPLLPDSEALLATESGAGCPAGTACAKYTLVVPASNPSFGVFSFTGTTFSTPAMGDVLYTVEGRAFLPMSGGTPLCSPSRLTTDKDSTDLPLKATAGVTVTAKQLDFTGCTAP